MQSNKRARRSSAFCGLSEPSTSKRNSCKYQNRLCVLSRTANAAKLCSQGAKAQGRGKPAASISVQAFSGAGLLDADMRELHEGNLCEHLLPKSLFTGQNAHAAQIEEKLAAWRTSEHCALQLLAASMDLGSAASGSTFSVRVCTINAYMACFHHHVGWNATNYGATPSLSWTWPTARGASCVPRRMRA